MPSEKTRKLPKQLMSPGILRAGVFILLVLIALGFWLYTKHIIDHIRVFQKAVITTQKEIYKGIIDPLSLDTGGISSDLFQKGVIESPFPIIFTDENNDPIPGLWRNVSIDPGETGDEVHERLMTIIEQMDRVNPPDSILIQSLESRIDTLIIYEVPSSPDLLFVITDEIGTPLLIRNIVLEDAGSLIGAITRLDPDPIRFSMVGEPPIVLYGTTGHGAWPVVVTTREGRALYWKGVAEPWSESAVYPADELSVQLVMMRMLGRTDTLTTTHITTYNTMLLHYGDPAFISLIVWLPVIEFLVIAILIAIGFIGLMNITRAEQRSIWVGMAKETAHQLGTPISSIDGWLELLKGERDESLVDQAVSEISTDVDRLSRVAARFSSIGSRPELHPLDVADVLDEVMEYFRKRLPNRGHRVELTGSYRQLRPVNGNRELLNWAVENLIKNALAAIENRQGRITVTGSMSKDFSVVVLDFKDNGRGIPAGDQQKIMKPGFTTNKRGWGLGLSLVKRIIEDYHGGTVFLLESRPNEGTTIRVVLPARKERGLHS